MYNYKMFSKQKLGGRKENLVHRQVVWIQKKITTYFKKNNQYLKLIYTGMHRNIEVKGIFLNKMKWNLYEHKIEVN